MKLTLRYIGGSVFVFLSILYLLLGNFHTFFYSQFHTGINSVDLKFSLASKSQFEVKISAEVFRINPHIRTGNPLIDDYGHNQLTRSGENGRRVTNSEPEKLNVSNILEKYRLNVLISDRIPLNRIVPDSRSPGCKQRKYPHDLPKTSIIIPFYDEWPSVLLRTVYSIIIRTPRHLVQEIILVDDNSQLVELRNLLGDYIKRNFPEGLVKLIRNPTREGLIKARIKGWRESTGEVVVFFDSHMEVNIDWLQPLLTAVKNDHKTIAMGMLDYIDSNTFEYQFYPGYFTRYGFDWRLVFFETFFRPDQSGPTEEDPRPGVVMVGPAYAVDSQYFGEIGAYDEGMKIWGGENLEFPWRVWMCGGRLLHFPCSRIGHIARFQPYSFPGGRRSIEVFNYKRAIEVWMEPNHKNFIYDHFPEMKNLPVGNLSERLKLKEKLQCHNFTWYLANVWPELAVFNQNAMAWGSVMNIEQYKCLDNHGYLFQAEEPLFVEICNHKLSDQGFSWTNEKSLRTSLQCVVVKENKVGAQPKLEDCIIGPRDTWEHKKNSYLKHVDTGMCLELREYELIMNTCDTANRKQQWTFKNYF